MRVITALLSSLLLGLMSACAPPTAPAPLAPADPALWRIADHDSEIWLFGTVHVLPPDLHWRTARIEAAFAAADELVVETDTTAANTGAALVAEVGMLGEGERLSALLPAGEAARLARVCAKLGVAPAGVEPLRPWLASLRLSLSYAIARGYDPGSGVEEQLAPEARARGMAVTFLETPEQQIRTLADLPRADEVRLLTTSLRQIEDDDASLDRLVAAWVRGDVEALAALSGAELRAAGPAAFEALMTRRNSAWADEIAQRLEGSGNIFYAVGAAHLVGDDSVIALLRARGVEVEGP